MGRKHIMIDIETLGRRPGCVVWEIGAAAFDFENEEEGLIFDRRIDVGDAVERGLEIETETARWWEERGGVRRHRAGKLEDVLRDFVDYVNDIDPETVWAWGMDFDFPILTHALETVGLGVPWLYWTKRDARTVWHVAYGDLRRPSRPHSAAEDCMCAVIDLLAATRSLKGGHDE